MNHCKICGNNIPNNVYDCEMAGYECQGVNQAITPDKVEEIVKDMKAKLNLDCWSPECACSGGDKVEAWLRTTLTQYHQDMMSEVVEKIICSAVRFQGKVWMGHRHGNALEAMHNELSYVMNRRQMNEQQTDKDQGFVTSSGRYVDRAEAWSIAEKAGQIIEREHQTKDCLYSEDVW